MKKFYYIFSMCLSYAELDLWQLYHDYWDIVYSRYALEISYSLHDKIYSFVTRFELVNSKRPDLWRYAVTWIHGYIYDIRSVDVDG